MREHFRLYFKKKGNFIFNIKIKSSFENAFGPSEPLNAKVNAKAILNLFLNFAFEFKNPAVSGIDMKGDTVR